MVTRDVWDHVGCVQGQQGWAAVLARLIGSIGHTARSGSLSLSHYNQGPSKQLSRLPA